MIEDPGNLAKLIALLVLGTLSYFVNRRHRRKRQEHERCLWERKKAHEIACRNAQQVEVQALQTGYEEWFRIERKRIGEPTGWGRFLDRKDVLIVDTEGQWAGQWVPHPANDIAIIDTAGSIILCENKLRSLLVGPKRQNEWLKIRLKILNLLTRATVVLAWNAPFDREVIKRTFVHQNEISTYECICWHDLLGDYRKLRPEREHTLQDAIDFEEVDEIQGHESLGDCLLTLKVMRSVALLEQDVKNQAQKI